MPLFRFAALLLVLSTAAVKADPNSAARREFQSAYAAVATLAPDAAVDGQRRPAQLPALPVPAGRAPAAPAYGSGGCRGHRGIPGGQRRPAGRAFVAPQLVDGTRAAQAVGRLPHRLSRGPRRHSGRPLQRTRGPHRARANRGARGIRDGDVPHAGQPAARLRSGHRLAARTIAADPGAGREAGPPRPGCGRSGAGTFPRAFAAGRAGGTDQPMGGLDRAAANRGRRPDRRAQPRRRDARAARRVVTCGACRHGGRSSTVSGTRPGARFRRARREPVRAGRRVAVRVESPSAHAGILRESAPRRPRRARPRVARACRAVGRRLGARAAGACRDARDVAQPESLALLGCARRRATRRSRGRQPRLCGRAADRQLVRSAVRRAARPALYAVAAADSARCRHVAACRCRTGARADARTDPGGSAERSEPGVARGDGCARTGAAGAGRAAGLGLGLAPAGDRDGGQARHLQ